MNSVSPPNQIGIQEEKRVFIGVTIILTVVVAVHINPLNGVLRRNFRHQS